MPGSITASPLSRVLIGERYELRKRLGAGGMAAVYLAWDTQLEREVAIKALRPHLLTNPTEVARFRDEAKLLARVESEHVVPIYDSQFSTQLCYIVLRRLVGVTLDDAVRSQRRNDAMFALCVAADVLAGVIDLHRKNIIHRDIKPSNVFVGSDDRAILLDLGVSVDQRAVLIDPPSLTAGTPSHMAPEQRATGRVDARTDIYQVGLVALFAALGVDPLRHSQDYRELADSLPPALSAIVQRATATDPADRYQTAVAMRKAVVEAIEDPYAESIPVIELGESDIVGEAPTTVASSIRMAAARRRFRRNGTLGAVGGMMTAAALGLAIWYGSHGDAGSSAAAAMAAMSDPTVPMVAPAAPAAAAAAAPPPTTPHVIVELTPVTVARPEPAAAKPSAKEPARVVRVEAARLDPDVDVAASQVSIHTVPSSPSEFLHAAHDNEDNGATEAAIAGYRQYVRMTPPGDDSATVRAHLRSLEFGRP